MHAACTCAGPPSSRCCADCQTAFSLWPSKQADPLPSSCRLQMDGAAQRSLPYATSRTVSDNSSHLYLLRGCWALLDCGRDELARALLLCASVTALRPLPAKISGGRDRPPPEMQQCDRGYGSLSKTGGARCCIISYPRRSKPPKGTAARWVSTSVRSDTHDKRRRTCMGLGGRAGWDGLAREAGSAGQGRTAAAAVHGSCDAHLEHCYSCALGQREVA